MTELREKMTEIMSQCYSKELSTCPNHPIFQPQKAINLLLTHIKESNYVRLSDDQSLPATLAYHLKLVGLELEDLQDKGFRRVELNETTKD